MIGQLMMKMEMIIINYFLNYIFIKMNINQYLDNRAAFRIFIHRKHEVPILSQNSLFLAPKTYTKLIFSQRIMTFSQQCRNDLTDDMKQIFNTPSCTIYTSIML